MYLRPRLVPNQQLPSLCMSLETPHVGCQRQYYGKWRVTLPELHNVARKHEIGQLKVLRSPGYDKRSLFETLHLHNEI